MKTILKTIILFLIILIPSQIVMAREVSIYLFYGDTCPICEKEREYLKELKDKYENIKIYELETYNNKTNYQNMLAVKEIFSVSKSGVPFTVVGDTSLLGFSEPYKEKIEYLVKKYTKEDYQDITGIYLGYKTDEKVSVQEETIKNDLKESKENNSNKKIEAIAIVSLIFIVIISILFIVKSKKQKRVEEDKSERKNRKIISTRYKKR